MSDTDQTKDQSNEKDMMTAVPVDQEAEEITEQVGGGSPVQSMLNLESMIHRFLADIDKTREKLKTQKDMLDDAFNNDAGYAEAMQKVKEATKAKNAVKQKIQKQEAIARLINEVDGIKDEIGELQDGLSKYLHQYVEQSGNNYFTGENGEVMEIVVVRKLVKKSDKAKG